MFLPDGKEKIKKTKSKKHGCSLGFGGDFHIEVKLGLLYDKKHEDLGLHGQIFSYQTFKKYRDFSRGIGETVD